MVSEPSYKLIVEHIQRSKKYKSLNIPDETIVDLIQQEANHFVDQNSLEDAVRKKLHNIVAPYLSDINYAQELDCFSLSTKTSDNFDLNSYCLRLLSQHASTRERLPYLQDFYEIIFNQIGTPSSLLDLACGINPFAIPFMQLPKNVFYYAYDIHKPRIDLINLFLEYYGMSGLAYHQDILVNPPTIYADTAFFFKEAHRLEKRAVGANRRLWSSLNVSNLVVSLPSTDLKHHHDLTAKHCKLIEDVVSGLNWDLSHRVVNDEILFFIKII